MYTPTQLDPTEFQEHANLRKQTRTACLAIRADDFAELPCIDGLIASSRTCELLKLRH